MKRKKDKPVLEGREKYDRRLLIFFSFWLLLGFLVSIADGFISGRESIRSLIPALISSFSTAFFFSGFLAFKYHRKRGIIPMKRILKWFALISLVIGLVFAAVIFWYATQTTILDDQSLELSGIEMIGMFIVLCLMGFIGGFIVLLGAMILGFGMIGVMSALIRSKTPELLVEIKKITPNISESMKKTDKKTYRGYAWLGWIFIIPYVLDTSTLTINHDESHKQIPWTVFKKAMVWQILFGNIVVIYISFNPFLLELMNMQALFSIASNVTLFIPILVLPWFIYYKLDVKIKGPVRDFRLYDGIKARMFQTLVAFGTILLLIRLALKNPQFQDFAWGFLGYFMFFVGGVFIFTFVYFNYFNDDLAIDIATKFEKIKD